MAQCIVVALSFLNRNRHFINCFQNKQMKLTFFEFQTNLLRNNIFASIVNHCLLIMYGGENLEFVSFFSVNRIH